MLIYMAMPWHEDTLRYCSIENNWRFAAFPGRPPSALKRVECGPQHNDLDCRRLPQKNPDEASLSEIGLVISACQRRASGGQELFVR